MSFSQKSDVKKHLAHAFKKTHYLTPEDQSRPVDKAGEISADAGGSATSPKDGEPIHVVNAK